MSLRLFLLIIGAALFVGGIALWLAQRRGGKSDKRQSLTKYLVFIVLIYGITAGALLINDFYRIILVLIFAGSFFELIRLQTKHSGAYGRFIVFIAVLTVCGAGIALFTESYSPRFFVFVFLVVNAFDGFSQVTGQLFGKRPVFPKISPNKTIGGLAGGLVFATVMAVLLRQFAEIDFVNAAVYGFFISLASLSGDWAASYVKRRYGVKDYSCAVPGHGGITDRFDSLMMTLSVFGFINFTA